MTKILIIEDNTDLQDIYRIFFEQEKFEVFIAADGIQGVTSVVQHKPDIVLLDIMIPQMDGFETLKALRQNSSIPCQIIVNTNLSQDSDKKKAMDLGADLFLVKSNYTPEEIVDQVKKILE